MNKNLSKELDIRDDLIKENQKEAFKVNKALER